MSLTAPEWVKHARAASVVLYADPRAASAMDLDGLRSISERLREGDHRADVDGVQFEQFEKDQLLIGLSDVHAPSEHPIAHNGGYWHLYPFVFRGASGCIVIALASMYSAALVVAEIVAGEPLLEVGLSETRS